MPSTTINPVPPIAGGFRMPAEWEPHEATWLAWPHEESDWPGKFEAIAWIYADIVRYLARVERVRILVQTPDAKQQAAEYLKRAHVDLAAVEFFPMLTDRSWTRDYIPTFLKDHRGGRALVSWLFNGWAKYGNAQSDAAIGEQLASELELQSWTPEAHGQRVVLEGGSFDVNGAGTLLTTEECLLSEVQQRNPGLSKSEYESLFRDYLGAAHTVWIKNGIAGDDTHGHIDDIARFTDARTIVAVHEINSHEVNYEPLHENIALLQQEAFDQNGSKFRIETLPMPEPVFFDGQRLPASYANFYVANNLVLVPTFNDPNDRVALNKLAELFPGRQAVGIASSDLVLGLGTLHCLTQQQPA